MNPVSLVASPRTVLGKKVKNLRRQGITPIHLYGPGGPSLALQAESSQLRSLIVGAGRTSPVSLTIEGDGEPVLSLVRDVAVHPVTGEVQHVDFLRVDPERRITAPVEVRLVGESPAVRGGLGVVRQVTRTLVVNASPLAIPSRVDVDIAGLEHIGAAIRVRDLRLPEGVSALRSQDDVIARVQRARAAEEEEAEAAAAAAAAEEEGVVQEAEEETE